MATERPPPGQGQGGGGCEGPLPSVSVIVATRNRPVNLEELVPLVLADPGVLEMVVVVDGADDRSSLDVLETLRAHAPRLVVVAASRGGQMRTLQAGLEVALGDVVLLLDDDVYPVGDLATGHARRHREKMDLVVIGNMPVADDALSDVVAGIYAEAYLKHTRALREQGLAVLDHLWMGNVSVRRDDCLHVGIWSPSYVANYYQDADFGFRLQEAGLVGVFDPSLLARHHYSRPAEAFLQDALAQGSGLAVLHRLHPDRLGPFHPRLLFSNYPPVVYLLFRVLLLVPTPTSTSRTLMKLGRTAGSVHLPAVEEFCARVAQQLMRFHGARLRQARQDVSVVPQ